MAANFWEKDAIVKSEDKWWEKDAVVGSKEEAPKDKGFFSNIGELAVEGGQRAIGSAKVSPSVISGNVGPEQAGVISEQLGMKPTVQPKELTEVQGAFKDEAEAWKKAQGFTESVSPFIGFVTEFGKQALTNPKGVAYMTAQSAANMAPSIAGMIAGGKMGSVLGPYGALGGAMVGGFAGEAPLEIGAEFIDNVGKELKARDLDPTKENVEAILKDKAFVSKAVSESRTKGATTAAVDSLMTAGAGRVATAPRRAAIKTAQTELGATADAAKIAARADEILKQGTRAERVGRTAKQGAKAVGLDVAGGGLSEAAGQYAAYGEVDPESVLLEMLGELGGSAIEVPSAAYATGRDALKAKAKKDAAKILEQERAATTKTEEPARVEPAQAPDQPQALDIEALEKQFGMAAPSDQTAQDVIAETTKAEPPATPVETTTAVTPVAEPVAKTEAPAQPAAPYVSPLESIKARDEATPEPAPANETPKEKFDRLVKNRIKMTNAFRDGFITNKEFNAYTAELEAARKEAEGTQPDVSMLSEAKQEILRMADEIEASGGKAFADGMRLNARPESKEPTAQNLEFYRSKLPQKKKVEEVVEEVKPAAYGLPEFFVGTPKDAARIADLRKSGQTKVRIALDEINDTIQNLADTIANAGYRMENVVPGLVPPAILRIKSQIGQLAAGANRLAAGAEAVQKGYKRADKKRVEADIKNALADIAAAEDLIAYDRNLPTAAEEMAGEKAPETPEVSDLLEQQRKAKDDMRRVENRGASLWTALAGKLSKEEVRGLGGRNLKIGKNQFLNLAAKKGKPETELADLVADGMLDPFLPPNMRHDAVQFDNTDSTEYIRSKLASGQYTTHETDIAIEQIGQEVLEIERRIEEELSLEEINREIQLANDEQREADQAAKDFATEGEAGVAAQREGEEATELDDLEKRAADAGIDVDAIREEVYYDTRGEDDINYERTMADRLRGALSVQDQFLAMQTEEELKAKKELEAQKEKTRKAEEKAKEEKAKADEAAADFVLTGSDREADEAAARGQSSMFSAEKGQTGYSPDPEDQRIEKELTGKTMLQAADWAVQNAPNAFAKVIAEKVRNRLRDLQRKGVELEFKIEGGNTRNSRMSGARGLTTANWGEKEIGTKSKFSITLNGAAVMENQAGYPPGTRYTTLLHELIHVATMGQLQFTPFPDPIRKQLRELSNAIVDQFNKDAKAGKLPPVMQKYYKRENNVLRDDDEVMAWGLTDEEVQQYYAGIKVGEKSAMSKLVDLVRQVLGLGKPYESALDRLVTVSESLLDADIETIEAVLGKSGRTLGETKAAPAKGEQQSLFQRENGGSGASAFNQDEIEELRVPKYKGRERIVEMRIDDFLNLANDYTDNDELNREKKERAERLLREGKPYNTLPYLIIERDGQVSGHEGRHRAKALKDAGYTTIPVVIKSANIRWDQQDSTDRFDYVENWPEKMKAQENARNPRFSIPFPVRQDQAAIPYNEGASEIGTTRAQQEGSAPAVGQNIFGEPVLGSWTQIPDTKLIGDLGKDDVIYKLQDKLIDTKRVVQAITNQVGKIANQWNPYLQEELYHGRTAKETSDFLSKELRPLMQKMHKDGITIGEFEQYLHNRHAEAYNRQVAKVNPNDPDMQDGGSGIATKDAQEYLANLPADKKAQYEALAKKLDAITKGTRELLVKSGLETKDAIDAWEKVFPDYVPLQREEEDFQYITSSTGTGRGFDVRGPFSRRAMGSKRNVVDILANVALQRENAIVKANKNRVAVATYGLAIQQPNPDFWLAINPEAEKVPEAALEELRALGIDDDAINFLMKEPRQRSVDPKKNEVMSRINDVMRNNASVLSARVNGQNRYVFFNPNNDQAARAASALKNLDADKLGHVLSTVSKITRWMASVNTQYNPIFGAYNFLRDTQGAALQLSDTPLAGKQKEVLKNSLPALSAIYSAIRGERKGKQVDTEMAKLWEDFQKAGGQTGFRDMYSRSQERSEALQKELRQLSSGKFAKLGRGMLDLLSDYNDTMENAVRLAAYKTALDNGISRDEAASIAKNLTVNFNRKGQIATQAGALYAFFNAGVQGTTRLVQTMTGPAGRKIMAGGLLWGAMQASLLAMAGFDDEEPPEFVRERNFIIPTGWLTGKKDYVTFPMPLGYHVIPGTSRILTEWAMSGFKDTPERLTSLTGMYLDAFNPIGNAGWSVQTIAPTFADPLVALAENKDWTGKPIAKKDFSGLDPTPGYTRAKDAATWYGTQIAKFLNFASGGTKYQPGVISPTPDQIDYLIGQATGGVGRELGKLATTVEKKYTGEDLPAYKIPVVGRFYGEATGSAAEASRFYKNLERINKLDNEIKGRKENHEPLGDFLSENPEARLAKRGREIQGDIKKLKERKAKLLERNAPRESIKVVEEQITRKHKLFNDQVASFKK